MKFIHDYTPCLLLLLLAELFVPSLCRPTALCGVFKSMIPQLEELLKISKQLHDLSDNEVQNFAGVEHRLHTLPHIPFTAAYFNSLKVNESLSQLYVYTQSFKLHVDWLKTARDNVSLPSESAESASTRLMHLSNRISVSLSKVGEEVPQTPSPSLPVVSTAFDALQFSVEVSERLDTFCKWSKRVLTVLSRCHGQ